MEVTFQILSYWRVGTGQGRGASLDAVCARDPDGLPFIPGRQVRGLFREAVTDAAEMKWFSGAVDELFGSAKTDGRDVIPDTTAGTLRFENARMLACDQAALKREGYLRHGLFDTKRSTAIDPQTGAARDRSLRFEEVAIPLMLRTDILPLPGAPADWATRLETAAPLIRGIGSGRNRGLGRVIVICNNTGAVDA